MLSKNNWNEQFRKQEPKKQRFTIKKLTVGVASVLLGFTFMAGTTASANDTPVGDDEGADTNGTSTDQEQDKHVLRNQVVSNDTTTQAEPETEKSPISDEFISKVESSDLTGAANQQGEMVNTSDREEGSATEADANQASTTQDKSANLAQKGTEEANTAAKTDNQLASAGTVTKEQVQQTFTNLTENATSMSENQRQAAVKDAVSQFKQLSEADKASLLDANKEKQQKEQNVPAPTVTNTPVTLDEVKKKYADLEQNAASMTDEERLAAGQELRAMVKKLPMAQRMALTTGTYVATTPDENGVVTVDNFDDFSKAFVNKDVKTIKLDKDLDFNPLTFDSSDVTGGLYSGGFPRNSFDWVAKHGLQWYELSTTSKDGIARDLTIDGQGHTMDMGKWFISLNNSDYKDNQTWNLTIKDVKLNTESTHKGSAPFHFNVSADNGKKSTITYDGVTANLQESPLVDNVLGSTAVNTVIKNSNITVTGTTAIQQAVTVDVEDSDITVEKGNFIEKTDGAINVKGTNNTFKITSGSFINQAGSTVNIEGVTKGTISDGSLVKTATADVALNNLNNLSVTKGTLVNTTADLSIAGVNNMTATLPSDDDDAFIAKNVNIADDSKNTLHVTIPSMTSTSGQKTGPDHDAFRLGTGSDQTASQGNFTMGQNSSMIFNKGIDQKTEGHNLRFLYSQNIYANVILNEGANLDLTMGTGHSSGIYSGDIDIKKNATLNINTRQDNNKRPTAKEAVEYTNDYFHYGPIVIGDSGKPVNPPEHKFTFNVDGTLRIVRGNEGEDISGVAPMIAFGGRSRNPKQTFIFNLNKGATLDLQDSSSTKYDFDSLIHTSANGLDWIDSDFRNVNFAGLITMFGVDSKNRITFNNPAYVNLQRRGSEYGSMFRTEGTDNELVINAKDAGVAGTPLAIWSKDNRTDTPTEAWRIESMRNQMNGGDFYANFLPAGSAPGLNHNFGSRFNQSNGSVTMAPFEGKYSYENGSYTGKSMAGVHGVGLAQLTNDFNWWSPRRITFGENKSIQFKDNTKHAIETQTITKTTSDKVADLNTQDLQNGISDLLNTDNTVAQDHQALLGDDSLIDWTNSKWGVDWSVTDFKDGLNTDTSKLSDSQLNAFNVLKKIASVNPAQDANGNFVSTPEGFNWKVATIVYKDSEADHPSTEFVFVPIEVKSQADLYNPQGQNLTTQVNQTVNAEDGIINKDTLPTDASYSWVKDPDVSKPGVIPSVVKVTYNDKTIDYVPVNVKVTDEKGQIPETKTEADLNSPKGIDQDTVIGKVPEASSSITWTNGQPKDTDGKSITPTYNWANEPDVYTKGAHPAVVEVSYPDGSKDLIPVNVNVTNSPTGLPQVINQGTKRKPAVVPDAKTVIDWTNGGTQPNGTQPSGATYTWVTTPDLSVPGKTTGIVQVTYPNGETANVVVPVTITDNDTTYNPYAENLNLPYNPTGAGVPDAATVVKLPKGDTAPKGVEYTWVTSPDTTKPGVQSAEIMATYKSSDGNVGQKEIPVIVTIGSMADYYKPAANDLTVHKGADMKDHPASGQITGIPEDVKTTDVWSPEPVTSVVGTQPSMIKVTYADGSSDYVPLNVTVKISEADENSPVAKDIVVPEGTTPEAKDAIENSADLDKVTDLSDPTKKTQYSWETTPDVTPGKHDATVIVTYPDGSQDKVSTHVTVNAKPTVKPISVEKGKTPVANNGISNINKDGGTTAVDGYPSSAEWETTPDTTKTGVQYVQAKVSYPEGDAQTVEIPVVVTDPSSQTAISNENGVVIVTSKPIVTHKTSDKEVAGADKAIDHVDVYTYDENHKLVFNKQASSDFDASWADTVSSIVAEKGSTATAKEQAHNISVTFKEGSDAAKIAEGKAVSVPAKVTLYGASAKSGVTATHGKADTLPDPSALVDTSALTAEHNSAVKEVTWKGDAPYTDSLGTVNTTVTVNFTDGSKLDVPVSFVVNNNSADTYEPVTKPITISEGETPDPSTVVTNKPTDTVPEGTTKLPEGTTVTWTDPKTVEDDIKTPGKHDAKITISYPDGSKETKNTTVLVNQKPQVTPIVVTDGKLPEPSTGITNYNKDGVAGYPSKVEWANGTPELTPGVTNVDVKVSYPSVDPNVPGETTTISVPLVVAGGDQTIIKGDHGYVIITTDPAAVKAHETTGKTQVINVKDAIKSINAYKIDKDGKIATTPTTIDKANVTASWTKDIDTTVTTASADGKKIEGESVNVDLGSVVDDVLGNAAKTVTTNTFDITAAGAEAKDNSKVPVKIKLGSDLTDTQFNALVDNKIDGKQIASTAWQTKPTKTGDGVIRITFNDKNGNDATYLDVTIPKENMTVTGDDDAYTPTGKETTINQGKTDDPLPDPKNSVDPDSIKNVPEGTEYTWTEGKNPVPSTPGQHDVEVTVTYPDGTTDKVTTTVTVNATPDVKPIRIDENTPNPDPSTAIANKKDGVPGYPTTVTWKDGTPDTKTPGKTEVEVTVHYPSGEDQTIKVPVVVTENPDIKPIVVTPGVTPDITKTVTNLHPDGTNPGYPSTVTWQNPDDVPTKPGIYNPTVVITYPKVDGEPEPKTVVTTVPVVIPDTDQTVISNDKGVVIVTTQPVTSHKTSEKNAATDASVTIKSVDTYKIENGKISATPSSDSKTGVTASWDVNTVDANNTATSTSTANHDVTITFGADSDAVKAGITESGKTATESVSVALQGATKSTNTVDVTDPAAIQALSSDQLATLVNHADLDELPAGSVTGYSWATEPSVTNGKVGDNGVVKISFNDGTSLNVKVDGSQFNYAGQASEFAPHYADTTLQQGETKTVANDGWTDDKKPASEVTYALADNHPDWISIDSSTGVITYKPGLKQTESKDYTVPVTVTYGDGSTDIVNAKVTVTDKTTNVKPGDEGVTKDKYGDLFKDVTRTVNIPGQEEPTVQTVHFGRTGVYDETTGKFVDGQFGDWKILDGEGKLTDQAQGSWAAVDVPSKAGYIPSAVDANGDPVALTTDNKVPENSQVSDSTDDVTISITYTAGQQTMTYTFVDDDNNGAAVGQPVQISGNTDETKDVSLSVPAGYELAEGEELPTSYKFTAAENQAAQIHLKHKKTAADEDNVPAGYSKSDFSKEIKRTITVTEPGKAPVDHSQTITIKRSGTYDEATKKVTFGDWSKGSFEEYEAPTVPGYTASQAKVAAESDVTDGYTDPKISITYTADDSHQTFHYVDKDGNDAGVPDAQVTGKTDEQKHGSDVPVPDGWELVDTPSDFTIPAPDKDTAINVAIKHGETTVNPDDPKKPGDKIPGTKDQHYPAGVDYDDLNKTISRTVTIVNPDGTQNTITQQLSYKRNAAIDNVTREVTYGNWTPADPTQAKFAAVAAPEIKGYTADKTAPEVTPTNAEITDWTNHDVTINYNAGDQSVAFKFVDDTANGKVVETITLAGNTGDTKATGLAVPAGYELAADQTLPTNYTFTADNQPVTIHVVHTTTAADKDHVPAGYKTSDFAKEITRTITVTKPDGSKVDMSQTITITRTGAYDEVTKKVTFNPWTTGSFDKVTVPTIAGYTPSQTEVPAVDNVTDGYKDPQVEISYTKNPTQADQVTPKVQDITVNEGETPDPKDGIENSADLDKLTDPQNPGAKTTYTWKDGKTPDTTKPGDTTAVIEVTYPDGSKDEIPVTIHVKDNTPALSDADKYSPSYPAVVTMPGKTTTTDVQYPDGQHPTGKVTYTTDPATPDWINVDPSTGTITVTVPEGQSTDVITVPVTVTYPDNTAEHPSVDHPTVTIVVVSVKPSVTDPKTPTDVIDDPTKLPEGTNVEWTKGQTPDPTKKGDGQKTSVTVTIPGHDPIEIPTDVTYTKNPTQADQNTPKVQEIIVNEGETPDPKDGIANAGDLDKLTDPQNPGAKTTYTWKDGKTPDTTKPGDTTAVIEVTYPDGSKDEIPVTIHVKDNTPAPSDADKNNPVGQVITVEPGNLPDPADGIKNKDDLPAGTHCDWETTPDTTTPGDKTVTIVVTYPDGSQDKVSTTVHVNEPASPVDKVAPQVKPVTTPHGQVPTPADLITNKADLPAGTSYEWHDLAKVVQDVKVYGDHEEVVDVKYPDGSVTQVTVTITVPTPAADQDTTSEDSLPDTTDNTEVAVDTTNTGEQTSDNGQANATVTTTDTTVKGDSDGKDHAAAKKLPQTGNDASKTSAMLGLGMVTLTSLFGLAKRKKKQDD